MQYCHLKMATSFVFREKQKKNREFLALIERQILTGRQVMNTNVCTHNQILVL